MACEGVFVCNSSFHSGSNSGSDVAHNVTDNVARHGGSECEDYPSTDDFPSHIVSSLQSSAAT